MKLKSLKDLLNAESLLEIMGKGILLFVMGSLLSLSILWLAKTQQELSSVKVESSYKNKVLARQTAESAFNIAVSLVKSDTTLDQFIYTDNIYGGGSFDIAAINKGGGLFVIIAVGKHRQHSFEIIGSLFFQTKKILDAMIIDGTLENLQIKREAIISGIDLNPDGNSVHGIFTTDTNIFEEWSNSTQIIGKDGSGDVAINQESTPMSLIKDEILNHEDREEYNNDVAWGNGNNKTFIGSELSPVIIVVNGNVRLQHEVEGHGILLVNGNLEMSKESRWNGLVFVMGNSTINMKSDNTNAAVIEGALIVNDIKTLQMNKGTIIQYNSKNLEILQSLLESLETKDDDEIIKKVAQSSYFNNKEIGGSYTNELTEEIRNLLYR